MVSWCRSSGLSTTKRRRSEGNEWGRGWSVLPSLLPERKSHSGRSSLASSDSMEERGVVDGITCLHHLSWGKRVALAFTPKSFLTALSRDVALFKVHVYSTRLGNFCRNEKFSRHRHNGRVVFGELGDVVA